MATPGSGPQRFGCYIGNIDSSVSVEMLRQVFSSCGGILDASLNGNTEAPYRYGFIDFATEEARACALKYNGYTLVGRKLRVNISKGNVGRPDGGNGPREPRPSPSGGAPPTPMQQPMPPTMGGGGGLSPAEQQQAQLLIQLIQQGTVDPEKLTEAQRTLLVTALSSGAAAVGGAAPAPAPAQPQPMQAPQMGMYASMWGAAPYGVGMPYGGHPMMGAMMGPGGYGHGMPHQRHARAPSANPAPSEEVMKLREIQRKQFLKVVVEETEAYERKYVEKGGKGGAADDSSGSDDDDEEEKKSGEGHRRSHRGEDENGAGVRRANMDISDDGEEVEA